MTCESPRPGTLPVLIAVAFETLTADLMAHLHACGYDDLRPHHFLNVLRFVSADGVRPAEIARRAGVTQQAMSLVLADLEARGYVERVADPTDRRAQLARWAPRGLAAASTIEEWFTEMEAGWRTAAGGAAVDGAIATLQAVVAGGGPR